MSTDAVAVVKLTLQKGKLSAGELAQIVLVTSGRDGVQTPSPATVMISGLSSLPERRVTWRECRELEFYFKDGFAVSSHWWWHTSAILSLQRLR